MTDSTTLPMNTRTPIGIVTVGRTAYRVFALATGENSKRAGVLANFALVGPRDASYFVTDYGPRYQINSIACGGDTTRPHWVPAPRSLRGLTREHLLPFLSPVQSEGSPA